MDVHLLSNYMQQLWYVIVPLVNITSSSSLMCPLAIYIYWFHMQVSSVSGIAHSEVLTTLTSADNRQWQINHEAHAYRVHNRSGAHNILGMGLDPLWNRNRLCAPTEGCRGPLIFIL